MCSCHCDVHGDVLIVYVSLASDALDRDSGSARAQHVAARRAGSRRNSSVPQFEQEGSRVLTFELLLRPGGAGRWERGVL